MKYLRLQRDGSVYLFNEILAQRKDIDTFICRNEPPEYIPNLAEWLEADKKTGRKAKSADEVVAE